MAFSLPVLGRANCDSITSSVRGLEDWKLGLPLCLQVSVDASSCPESRTAGSRAPRSHCRDFCSEESRCDDNHLHLKSSEAWRAKPPGVLRLHNSQSVPLLTAPPVGPAVVWTAPSVCGGALWGAPQQGSLGPHRSLLSRTEQQMLPVFGKANYTAFMIKMDFSVRFCNLVM